MVPSYIMDDQDSSSLADCEEKITQHDQSDGTASVVAPTIAYSTLTSAPNAQLGLGLFNAASDEYDVEMDLREAIEDLNERERSDGLHPDSFVMPLIVRKGPVFDDLVNPHYFLPVKTSARQQSRQI